MKTVIIASSNPVKVNATLEGFHVSFPDEEFSHIGIKVDSPVSAQPMSSQETLQGALERARMVKNLAADADFWVGIEGGVEPEGDRLVAFAWVVVLDQSRLGEARSASFYLPDSVASLVHAGKELGEADDIVFQRNNSKQENGAVGILTNNAVTRQTLYQQAVILALIPFLNPALYPEVKPG